MILWLAIALGGQTGPVKVGSKVFTESVILGEMARGAIASTGVPTEHRRELGGTQVLFHALEAGDLDVYPEYTGTIAAEILGKGSAGEEAVLRAALLKRNVLMGRPLGFNNTYAIGVKETLAARLRLRAISDLRVHPALKFGFSNEFMDRADGWPTLRDRYRLPQKDVRGLDHDLAYRALNSGELDATDLYSTDAEILAYKLRVLQDDLGVFPRYECVWLYRADLKERAPEAVAALERLEGKIDAATMAGMNARAKNDRIAEDQVAADFLATAIGITASVRVDSYASRLWVHLVEHLELVTVSLTAAILAAIPLGVLAAKRPRIGHVVLAATGLIQTIPSLALLVFMIPLLGIGARPALAALFLYSLLPIVRNTATGLRDIPVSLRESAEALGLPAWARLRRVELPLAARSILGGIKTAAVINVGTATIGALIGAGGFGQPILTGLRLDDRPMMLFEGVIPSALLALAVQAGFDLLERAVVPKGLR